MIESPFTVFLDADNIENSRGKIKKEKGKQMQCEKCGSTEKVTDTSFSMNLCEKCCVEMARQLLELSREIGEFSLPHPHKNSRGKIWKIKK